MSDDDFTECIVCGNNLPIGKYSICSKDCYTTWQVERWRAERKRKQRLPQKAQSLSRKITTAQSVSQGKIKRNCDYCKTEFMASASKVFYCTPQCAILSGKRTPEYSQRRIPSMPKMPWD